MPSQLERRRGFLLCAAFLACSLQLPVLAQQSDWITPGSPEAQVDRPMTQQPQVAPVQQGADQSGINPGRGWRPQHSLPSPQQEAPMMAPVQQQAQMAPMQQPMQQNFGGPQLGEDGSMPWQDLPKQRRQPAPQPQQAMQAMPPASSAFQQPQSGAQDAWSLPTAQQQMDMQWAQNMPSVPLSAVTPGATAKAPAKPAAKTAAAKPGAKPAAKTATAKANPNLSGHVTQSANAVQPTTQFDPNTGFPAQTAGAVQGPYGMPMQNMQQGVMPMQGMQQMGAMQPMQGMQQMGAMQPMQGMQQMGAMQPMQNMAQIGGAAPMQGMSPMGGAAPMQGMSPMGGMGGMSGMSGMGGMGGGMGMDPMSAMMGATGGSGNPLDAIGRAIAGAAAMGLIPSSGNANLNAGYNPNVGPYAQIQAVPTMNGQQMPMQQVSQSQLTPAQQQSAQQAAAQKKKKQQQQQQNLINNVGSRVTQAGSMMMNMGLSRIQW